MQSDEAEAKRPSNRKSRATNYCIGRAAPIRNGMIAEPILVLTCWTEEVLLWDSVVTMCCPNLSAHHRPLPVALRSAEPEKHCDSVSLVKAFHMSSACDRIGLISLQISLHQHDQARLSYASSARCCDGLANHFTPADRIAAAVLTAATDAEPLSIREI